MRHPLRYYNKCLNKVSDHPPQYDDSRKAPQRCRSIHYALKPLRRPCIKRCQRHCKEKSRIERPGTGNIAGKQCVYCPLRAAARAHQPRQAVEDTFGRRPAGGVAEREIDQHGHACGYSPGYRRFFRTDSRQCSKEWRPIPTRWI